MDALNDTDVLYVTRIQRERFDSQEEYEKVRVCNHCTEFISSQSTLWAYFNCLFSYCLLGYFLEGLCHGLTGHFVPKSFRLGYLALYFQVI